MAERDRADVHGIPLRERAHGARSLGREVDARRAPESEGTEVLVQRILSELRRDEDRARVRRALEDLRHRRRAVHLALRVVEPSPADDRVALVLVRCRGRDDARVDTRGDRDGFHRRARLIRP